MNEQTPRAAGIDSSSTAHEWRKFGTETETCAETSAELFTVQQQLLSKCHILMARSTHPRKHGAASPESRDPAVDSTAGLTPRQGIPQPGFTEAGRNGVEHDVSLTRRIARIRQVFYQTLPSMFI